MLNNVFLTGSTGGGLGFMVVYFAIIGLVFYFIAIRPQKKQQKEHSHISFLSGGRVLWFEE